jgi:hypothetical protein
VEEWNSGRARKKRILKYKIERVERGMISRDEK